ncbi:p7 protein [pistacia virus B]|uniref:P7 protein n=1 Tax=pistacia virus B TaxID=2848035 RepID=A0A410JAM9_9VIRU|nr:p7 protein [Pistacia emaravirus]QAR18009.1 p7 protein [pistacia virus B]
MIHNQIIKKQRKKQLVSYLAKNANMEHIKPYTNSIGGCTIKLSNKEKISDYKGLSSFEENIYNQIKNKFNNCECFEKDVFFDEDSKMPKNASISYIEINDQFPRYMYTIKKMRSKYKYSLTNIDDLLFSIIKNHLHNFIIREFESDINEINIIIKGFLHIPKQFVMVKINNKNLLINDTKYNWENIISSTTLCDLRSILSHFDDMRDFYYKKVQGTNIVKSIYSFINDNKSLINHVLPSIKTSFKTYDDCVLKYINAHLKKAYNESNYSLVFDSSTIQEFLIETESCSDFSLEVRKAIHEDVTKQLEGLKTQFSEYDILKMPCLELVNQRLVPIKHNKNKLNVSGSCEQSVAFPLNIDEIVKYPPGENPIQDNFYYGLPNTLEISTQYLNSAMRKIIQEEKDIDDIDYIAGYPFKRSYKILIFSILKKQNYNIRISHLFLHYFCYYMYAASVASIRVGVDMIYEQKQIDRAREFSKKNISVIRNLVQSHKHLFLQNQCVSITLA